MFKVNFIVVDRTRSPFLREGEDFYLKRLKPYARTDWIIVKPEKVSKSRPEEQIIRSEGQAIIRQFPPRTHIVALDRAGKAFTSTKLASHLEALLTQGNGITFVIGGPLGLSSEVCKTAHETLSLSKLTLTHEMSRLFLLEQVYRAFTIIHGTKYHK